MVSISRNRASCVDLDCLSYVSYSISVIIITFPNHEIYNYFKLIVDNFFKLHGTRSST